MFHLCILANKQHII